MGRFGEMRIHEGIKPHSVSFESMRFDRAPTLVNLEKARTFKSAFDPSPQQPRVSNHTVAGVSLGAYVSRLVDTSALAGRGAMDALTFTPYDESGARRLVGAAQRSVDMSGSFDAGRLKEDLRDYGYGSNAGLGLGVGVALAGLGYGTVRLLNSVYAKTVDASLMQIVRNIQLSK